MVSHYIFVFIVKSQDQAQSKLVYSIFFVLLSVSHISLFYSFVSYFEMLFDVSWAVRAGGVGVVVPTLLEWLRPVTFVKTGRNG